RDDGEFHHARRAGRAALVARRSPDRMAPLRATDRARYPEVRRDGQGSRDEEARRRASEESQFAQAAAREVREERFRQGRRAPPHAPETSPQEPAAVPARYRQGSAEARGEARSSGLIDRPARPSSRNLAPPRSDRNSLVPSGFSVEAYRTPIDDVTKIPPS